MGHVPKTTVKDQKRRSQKDLKIISFQPLAYKQTQTLLFLSICCRTNSWDNIMLLLFLFASILEELLGRFFILIVAWKLRDDLLRAAEQKATLGFLLD